jgi:CRISPR-associated protein Cas1
MIKRTIYIGSPAYLKIKNQQLVVQEPEGEIKGTVPIEDIAMLVLDHYQITISNLLITQLQENNAVIINCDAQHLPFGMMLPLYGHSEHSERIKWQVETSEPLKKQLWKQTVEQKIRNQQAVLKQYNKPFLYLSNYLKNVKSGDTSNAEGIAAQYYWKHLFESFARERFGDAPNNFLNYGYSILRAIVARALVSSGLMPVLGIFHRNKYNPYCLADDIMEPYRPYVDRLVYEYMEENSSKDELTKQVKAYLLQIATEDVEMEGRIRPLMVAVTITTASLVKCYSGELRIIKYPSLLI